VAKNTKCHSERKLKMRLMCPDAQNQSFSFEPSNPFTGNQAGSCPPWKASILGSFRCCFTCMSPIRADGSGGRDLIRRLCGWRKDADECLSVGLFSLVSRVIFGGGDY